MNRIWKLKTPIRIQASASAVGKEEYEGPYGAQFDFHSEDDLFGGDTWEHAEGNLSHTALNLLYNKAGITQKDIGLLIAGDLQNQCVASAEAHAGDGIPYLGIYGACSNTTEAMILASIALNANQDLQNACIVTTSHHCAAERQFRLPLEYGGQRPPTAQWTATAGGAYLLSRDNGTVAIKEALVGRMVDAGVSDAANMGAAMAPAALDTLLAYFQESGKTPDDFDSILTGDLGIEGSEILLHLAEEEGLHIKEKHCDCGALLYDADKKDVHGGASGCGCAAALFSAHFLPAMQKKAIKRMLFMATGALMSPSSIQQGGHIIGIGHLVSLEVV